MGANPGTWTRHVRPHRDVGRRVVGFTIAVVHPGSWTLAPLCYLEDCRQEGWSRLYQ
ncbi:MAG: hypothetical protein WBW08_03575 [Methyloceanibacter sp.]